jgi:protein-disulfide isomerase
LAKVAKVEAGAGPGRAGSDAVVDTQEMDETLAGAPREAFRHSFGAPDAPVVVVEFGDFQCPYCARAAPVLRELVESSEGQVRLVFRHFPIYDIHPFALTAALAAEAAGAHGKFWELHHLLFTHQDMLADYKLKYYAESIGLDGDLVVGDAAQPYGDAVEADYTRGVELGVRGTPTLFINGVAYRDRVELPALRKATGRSGDERLLRDKLRLRNKLRLSPRARR